MNQHLTERGSRIGVQWIVQECLINWIRDKKVKLCSRGQTNVVEMRVLLYHTILYVHEIFCCKEKSLSRKQRGVCGGLRLKEIWEDERQRVERVESRRPVVGFGWEETDKCWRVETQSVRCIVVGLDLVKVQILIPVLPLCLSHPLSSSPVPRKTDPSTLIKREKKRPQHQQHT